MRLIILIIGLHEVYNLIKLLPEVRSGDLRIPDTCLEAKAYLSRKTL